ncbi:MULTISPECIES: aldehyde dehydrogenase family protein [unclassified Mycolicibacterium]|uniref:L-piperidine-6-carboxylate dehydrogenase n=1 Tax=unclassified Mycolicibacterium TaxID=2636767 RepID=UPI0012DF5536|nr:MULTISPECIES: aldehyde dehydrogenase family protein [unclassified Mycolicibacterium]MUL83070.1 aldehyde dehydrogenase family protein [Mycolicibacterium sp. CBMA 329]MUL89405.1 aldehyde dehydrogenase family protein [Mycolicibacterium sp. CBMA 331]MUL99094.1 aldehyde dehydrogenase family protein [Mycolicibacterium sp. CBMA 334]MUM24720.1 aldehyde dehydrogenase family protein [Mycolicibacterium sp. CBMA 295]MUM38921.1 aldehyde dehydrogenase family protein [Mycolicibacterium sp. CBMA 247]
MTSLARLELTTTDDLRALARTSLMRCGVDIDGLANAGASTITTRTPITGEDLFDFPAAGAADVERAIDAAHEAYLQWRTVPAPVRGLLIKRLGELLTEHKSDVANLISIEVGKIGAEALGEVQEMIDICDFAVGLSRQLDGRTMPSERPGHRLMETWHPLGVVGVISAFNFPAAVWSWNLAIAIVCGDTVVWKPAQLTTLTAAACSALFDRAARDVGAPENLNVTVSASSADSAALIESPKVPLVSATGSERMGAEIAPRVAGRFGRAILELGGNNAAIVTPSADLDLATRGIVFSAAGTAGQRCTTMRRVIAHEDVAEELIARIVKAYSGLPIGDPLSDATLVGPLINEGAFAGMSAALEQARAEGGTVLVGGERRDSADQAFYVEPAVVRMPQQSDIVRAETFAPILYVMTYSTFEEAIALHNGVPQGLSSAIFTLDQREAERFIAADGSDCGLANVNIGTSGAEIGGAFGGEKTTGGGRESGSDAWRAYMRRATNTINYSLELPLAQGVSFT